MHISVIIPVFNAANFVTQAVESALQQSETAEVILVEDGSPDNAWEVCQEIAEHSKKVHLFRHPNGENRGAGASRNLGMAHSSCEYIAFLDADDYYLPGRFSFAQEIFQSIPECEGVYEAIGMHVEDDLGFKRWEEAGKSPIKLLTMKKGIAPEQLPEALLNSGKFGYFHLNGFTIKKNILEKSGYMNERLRLHQDTDFMIRASCVAKLYPGRLDEPVSMWRVHDHNRISASRSDLQKQNDRLLMWIELYRWSKVRGLATIQNSIMNMMVLNVISNKRFGKNTKDIFPRQILRLAQFTKWLLKFPFLILDQRLWNSVIHITMNW